MSLKNSNRKDLEKEKKLLQGIREGDENSFSKIFHLYYEDLCRFTLNYTAAPDVAEDIAQDIFLGIWRKRKTLKVEGSFKSYIFKTARNNALNYLRHKKIEVKWKKKEKRENKILSNSPDKEIQQSESFKELEKAIEEAIDQLPERRKLIFSLSRDEGLTYQEISIVLDISVKTVETQIRRSKITLRELLAKYLPAIVLYASQNL